MACLLKAPNGSRKGCISFTTQERDNLINKDPALKALILRLKERFVIGLHHNWHDHAFHYDPLYDFSMAGDGDLIEKDGRAFKRVNLDACNFAPPFFNLERERFPYWDILNISRAVEFKGIPQFFQAMRHIYDTGTQPRTLFLCSVNKNDKLPSIPDLRSHFEAMFTREERQRFTFMTMDWDYPFPLDLETLAFFYRSSRLFVHPAPQERRCRTAAYAWACGIPVIGRTNIASILPERFHTPPYFFRYEGDDELADAIRTALEHKEDAADWQPVAQEFQTEHSVARLDAFLKAQFGSEISDCSIQSEALDIRLGRHHGLAVGGNRLEMELLALCSFLASARNEDLLTILAQANPEMSLIPAAILTKQNKPTQHSLGQVIKHMIISLQKSSKRVGA